jgi:hypothetical protein
MSHQIWGLLVRSAVIPSDRLEMVCTELMDCIQTSLHPHTAGCVHLQSVDQTLEWLTYSPDTVTAGIVTIAAFGKQWQTVDDLPVMPTPSLVIEIHLAFVDSSSPNAMNELEAVREKAETLTSLLQGFLEDCGVGINETKQALLARPRNLQCPEGVERGRGKGKNGSLVISG